MEKVWEPLPKLLVDFSDMNKIFLNRKTAFFLCWSLTDSCPPRSIDIIIDAKPVPADHGLVYFLSYLVSL